MANTSKVIDLDRLARFKAKQDAANGAKFALKGEACPRRRNRSPWTTRRRTRHPRARHSPA